MGLKSLLKQCGAPIEDADEETFLLFSQGLPDARDLGFVDSKASTISVPIGDGGDEVTLTQSPSLLGSSLSTGTTGAVLWRVSPLLASWLRHPDNPLFENGILGPHSAVLELGCGVAGITALAAAPKIGQYICTDQQYVLKLLRQNIVENLSILPSGKGSNPRSGRRSQKARPSKAPQTEAATERDAVSNIRILALDWETSLISSLAGQVDGLTDSLRLVLACDCIYNSHLVQPFVRTCAELCRLRDGGDPPTICLVAQQLRSEDVFCEWLDAFMQEFVAWRVPDGMLLDGMHPTDGFVLHVGVLRSAYVETVRDDLVI